jgi:ketosteroid isomerase-like protein
MLLIALSAGVIATSPPPDQAVIVARTEQFLQAYARDDVQKVLAMTAPDVTVYGSDEAEYCEGAACLAQTMADDFALWKTARFGQPSRISVRSDGRFATIFFNLPFSAGGRPDMPIRMSLTWRKSHGVWLLTQSSNVVPTRGSSAAAILHSPSHP